MFASIELIKTIATAVVATGLVGFIVVFSVMKSDDPGKMIVKWILTAGIAAVMYFSVLPQVSGGFGILYTAVWAVVLAAIWRRTIAGWVANPIGSLYDGGNEPPIPRPAYSVAQARQKQGRYLESVLEIRKQLDRFPTDFEGHILLAEVQAEDLNDLQAAETTIQQLCSQPGHAPINIVFALYSMADWHLKHGQDREAARRNFQKVIDTFPDTEYALVAAQRIARLGATESLLAPNERKRFAVAEGVKNLGL